MFTRLHQQPSSICKHTSAQRCTYYDQLRELTELRKEPEYSAIPAKLQRWTLSRLDDSFKAFFRRVKAGEEPGFPRFKGKNRWRSFGFAEFHSIRLRNNRLYFKGMSSLRVYFHRPLPEGKMLSCTFTEWH